MADKIHAQFRQLLIFEKKSDSIAYAHMDIGLIPILDRAIKEQNFGTADSVYRMRRQFLEGKAFVYRTTFNQDRSYTPYQGLGNITNKDSITKISVLGKGRRKLPGSLYRYKNLADLELIDFKLRKLPRKLHVKRLTLYNNFPSRPLKVSKNTTITNLTIRGDEKGMLPKRFNKLRALEVLTLTRNNLKVFPNVEGCNNLKTLNLNNNEIGEIDPAVATLVSLENLSLYKNNLREVPDALYTLRELRTIDLYYNRLSKLSPAVANWKKLEILYLANNEIYSIPNEIGELTSLREIGRFNLSLNKPDIHCWSSTR